VYPDFRQEVETLKEKHKIIDVPIFLQAIQELYEKNISVPVEILISKADQVCRGDFLQPVSMNRTDEFGTLANAFNRMSETIESQISSLKTALAERDKALHSLSQSYNEISQLSYISAHHFQEPVRVMINYSDLF